MLVVKKGSLDEHNVAEDLRDPEAILTAANAKADSHKKVADEGTLLHRQVLQPSNNPNHIVQ